MSLALENSLFQAAFTTAVRCDSPPDFMVTFPNIPLATSDAEKEGEASPLSEQELQQLWKITVVDGNNKTCGNSPQEVKRGCCISSLDLEDSEGYKSWTTVKLEGQLDKNLPVTANGFSYCHVLSQEPEMWSNYTSMYILDNDKCQDRFKCTSGGILSVYSQKGCEGTATTFGLSSASQALDMPGVGGFSGQYSKVTAGELEIQWTAFSPFTLLVPNWKDENLEFVQTGSYILSSLGTLFVFVYFYNKWIATKTSYMLWFMISQLLWVAWILLDGAYYHWIFTEDQHVFWTAEVRGCFFGAASLVATLNTASFLTTFMGYSGAFLQWCVYLLLVGIHIVFGGSKYMDYWRLSDNDHFVNTWKDFNVVWILFMFAFNTAPAFYVTVSLVRTATQSNQMSAFSALRLLQKADKKFSILVFVQIVNSCTWVFLNWLQNHTMWAGSDRRFLSLYGLQALCFTIHQIVSCFFILHVRIVLRLQDKLVGSTGRSRTGVSTTDNNASYLDEKRNTSLDAKYPAETSYHSRPVSFASSDNDVATINYYNGPQDYASQEVVAPVTSYTPPSTPVDSYARSDILYQTEESPTATVARKPVGQNSYYSSSPYSNSQSLPSPAVENQPHPFYNQSPATRPDSLFSEDFTSVAPAEPMPTHRSRYFSAADVQQKNPVARPPQQF